APRWASRATAVSAMPRMSAPRSPLARATNPTPQASRSRQGSNKRRARSVEGAGSGDRTADRVTLSRPGAPSGDRIHNGVQTRAMNGHVYFYALDIINMQWRDFRQAAVCTG